MRSELKQALSELDEEARVLCERIRHRRPQIGTNHKSIQSKTLVAERSRNDQASNHAHVDQNLDNPLEVEELVDAHIRSLPDRSLLMDDDDRMFDDRTPGVEQQEATANFLSYTAGLGLAILLTITSFVVAQTNLLWSPGVLVGLIVLALAQIGVHLVFFLHLGSGPDHTNNILALTLGILIVFLVIGGSCWIMANLNANMMPMFRNPAGHFERHLIPT
jgi:cytochrome o ubiquinol oxidase subunit IV